MSLPFVKSVRIKEAIIEVLNSDNYGEFPYFQSSIDWNNNSTMKFADPRVSLNHDPDNNLDRSARTLNGRGTALETYDATNQMPGQQVYYIKSVNAGDEEQQASQNQMNMNQSTLNESSMQIQSSRLSRKPPMPKSILQKSRSIVDLFKSSTSKKSNGGGNELNGERKMSISNSFIERSELEFDPAMSFTTYPGKNNFVTSASFKAPEVWNCDWNLNQLPKMHIK